MEDGQTSPQEIRLLKARMAESICDIAEKHSKMTLHDLKRLLFRCAATIIALEKVGCL
jgi:phosphatidylinositol 4-kinase A